MSTNEQARERLTQQRQHEDHVKETMLNRSEAEIEHPVGQGDHAVDEQAREALAHDRQHEEHVKETMRNRAQSELQQ
ncbi:MAG: hypothetical protein Kow00121_07980 [Elainellaceae cyanobacterium]